MSVFGRLGMALSTAWRSGLRAYQNPESGSTGNFSDRLDAYRILWSYYNNSTFERVADGASWESYKGQYRLYPFIRSIYNPTNRLVQFYVGAIYPGVLAARKEDVQDGMQIAMPLVDGTDEALFDPIDQVWQWGNWQRKKDLQVIYGAALGDIVVEIIDDLDRERVYPIVHWPGRLTELERDARGNTERAVIEYSVAKTKAEDGYRYKKILDRESISEYRDDKLYMQIDNPYGFVPLVVAAHNDVGSDHGEPAIAGLIGKIDQLNDLASRINKQISITVESPQVIATDSKLENALTPAAEATLEQSEMRLRLLKATSGSSTFPLAGNLSLSEALPILQEQLKEIEHDCPELTMYAEMRGMSSLTGPAASRLLGDVQGRILAAAAGYDQLNTQVLQMSVAIGGERVNRGDWKRRDAQQAKFAPFDLSSYGRGLLDIRFDPRPLVPTLAGERIELEEARSRVVTNLVGAGMPLELAMKRAGYEDKDVASITVDRIAAMDRERQLALSDVPRDGLPVPAQ